MSIGLPKQFSVLSNELNELPALVADMLRLPSLVSPLSAMQNARMRSPLPFAILPMSVSLTPKCLGASRPRPQFVVDFPTRTS